MTKMKPSLFVPSAETYSKSSIRCIGYERECVPYSFHSLKTPLIRAIPHFYYNWHIMRTFLALRTKALAAKDSKQL